MSDFPDEELDPEMIEDHEENAPGLEEALEEIFENADREELEGLMDPADADVTFSQYSQPSWSKKSKTLCHLHTSD